MVPQSSLVRPARVVVLDPIADEVADPPRVELDRHLHPDLAIGRNHQRADVLRQVETLRRLIEVIIGRLEGLHQTPVLAITGQTRSAGSIPPAPILTDHPRTRNGTERIHAPRAAETVRSNPRLARRDRRTQGSHANNNQCIHATLADLRDVTTMEPWRLAE